MNNNNNSKTIDVSFDIQTYNKLLTFDTQVSDFVRESVKQYLRSKEQNKTLNDDEYDNKIKDFYEQQIILLHEIMK
jgi:hypothetical protein